jgi:hypothetical protein
LKTNHLATLHSSHARFNPIYPFVFKANLIATFSAKQENKKLCSRFFGKASQPIEMNKVQLQFFRNFAQISNDHTKYTKWP